MTPPGSWIEVAERYEARLEEYRRLLKEERQMRRVCFDFLSEVGLEEEFTGFLARANQLRAVA